MKIATVSGQFNLISRKASTPFSPGNAFPATDVARERIRFDKAYIGSVIVNDGNGRFYEPAPQRNILLGVQANLQF